MIRVSEFERMDIAERLSGKVPTKVKPIWRYR